MLPRNTRCPRSIFRFTPDSCRQSYASKVHISDKDFIMTEPVSNVMLVICSYSPVPPQAAALEVDYDWCLELAASVDAEAEQPITRTRYIFETLAVHPTRKFASPSSDTQARRSLNSPYFRLLKARARRVPQATCKSPVSSLMLAVNPACRAYVNLAEERKYSNFSAKPENKRLRQLVCSIAETQKEPATAPQYAIRTAHDPVQTLRLQPFFVAQPVFSPA